MPPDSPQSPKSRLGDIAPDAETLILRLAREEPELGQAAVAARLQGDGVSISPSGVRYLWQKHGLETTVKRLQALVDRSEAGLEALSVSQRALLERGTLTAQLARTSSAEGDAVGDETLDRRQIILNAAAELFSAQGYDRTSIRDIARRVGLLPGSVYHHFASKDELYLAVHREGFHRVMSAVTSAISESDDPWERLRCACEVHVQLIVEGPPVERVTGHNLALVGNEALLAKIQPERERYEQLFRELVQALPVSPGTDLTMLRLFLLGGMNWVYLWYRKGKQTPRAIADAMVRMIRYGVSDQ
ncbi:MAG TPA: TetR/AcrR family transcriptional regulator [Aromatoleum sp.]|uniref:TetR/AcrR family transcriptional regulator n=1 Tax=Aromatoleum sp. TaxID=2307007 RepID=UPI002B47086C|nr:TetR/AcrR family transcriptional regulator [Aromatoleum sp.]HJV28666.1 TetR/AcrR family transcriptional regulator [Aromatoleum sp.]